MSADREDFLTEDPEIPSQRWCLLSFLSPEKVLNRKELFFFESFLKQYEFHVRSKSLEKYLVETVKGINEKLDKEAVILEQQDLSGAAAVCRNSVVRIDSVMQSFHDYVKGNMKDLGASKLTDEYDDYLLKNKLKLEDDFYAVNDFKTTVRGLKVRGVYSGKEEAESRAKKLQRSDQVHNIFVGEVGKWLPWDPSPHEVGDQEYAEDQLNTLMKKYKENEEARDTFHREQRDSGRKQKRVFTAPDESTGTAPVTMTRETGVDVDALASAAASAAGVPSLGTGASEFAGMFSTTGHPDLAIARKADK